MLFLPAFRLPALVARRLTPLALLTALLLPTAPLAAQSPAQRAAAPVDALMMRALPARPPVAQKTAVLRQELALTAADDMRLLRTETDELGFVHERFQPYYQGVKVEHATISLHERGGKIETLTGAYVRPAAGLSARPALSEATALRRAMAAVGARQYIWQIPGEEAALKQQTGNPTATYQPHGELVWVGDFRQPEATRPVVLAWKFNIYAADPVSRAWVYVDARTGQEVMRDAIIKHVNAPGAAFATRYVGARTSITDNTGSGFRLRETATGKGVTTLNLRKSQNFGTAVDFIDNDNNWTAAEHNNANKDNAALDAHLGAQATQGYWTTVHGRDSYDDRGTVLLSYVHYGNNIDNAFWDGTAMLYGDGNTAFKPLTSIDVCAHEVGHAVMDATANLTYQGESGGMNEGFSDIWGCTVENFFDPTKQKYLIGEDITLPSFGTALRSMSNPNAHDQPDTYLGTNWRPTGVGQPDNGGVHYNSGVLNFWFYLLSNGGSGTNDFGTAFNVTGISIAKAEKIAYRTQRIYLTASSNYAAGRKASMQAAIDLYGLGSLEVQSTAQAWRAVGVGTTTGAAEAAPTITGFTPTSGLAGTVVTITGTNLGATMRVTFNGADATIATLASGTSLTVTVPPSASTGLISLSTAAGTVTTSALAPANFTITAAGPAPDIASFSPAGGQVQGGAVTITGTALTGATAVSFNGVAATILTNTATTITTTVPVGATSGPLTVTTANGTATAPTTFMVLPNILNFSPGNGAVGASVVLTGTTLTGALDVKFNGVYVTTYTVNSATQITATVPAGATTGPITVRTASGLATSATNFTVNPTLAFTSFSPQSGAVNTTVVNIRGLGFTGTTAVTFGGVNAPTFTVASDQEIFATVPVSALTGNIVLTTPLGTATSPAAFTVTAPPVPTITSFTPTSGVVGDPVTITGTNFTGATAVTFNSTTATFTVSNSTTIFTSVPAGATTGVIRVTVPGGTATSATSFSVLVPGAPVISSFTPANGNVGTVVTLTGTNFAGTTAVAFNGTAAAFTLVSSTSITTTAPAGGTTGQISVTNGFGTGLTATSFFFPPTNDLCANTGLPVLACGGSVSGTTVNSTSTGDPTATCTTSITAGAGGIFYRFVGTGGSVTMTTCAAGTNYDTKLFVFTGTCGSYTCVIGNDDASCGVISTASAVTFASVAGTNYFVFVSGFNSERGNFTLTATCVPVTPTITSFTPTSGPVGTSVDITGTNLTAASAVRFNGTAATTFTVNSATSITATVPAGATTGPIGVTVPGGSGVSASNFTVLIPAPVVTTLSPTRNLRNTARATSVAVTFDQPMSGSAASAGAVNVFSQQSGGRMSGAQGGAASVSGSTITFNPTTDFQAGETVLVTTTTAAQSSAGAALVKGAVHQFTTATGGTGVGLFGAATSVPGGNTTSHLATGDLNADGRPDLLWTNYGTTTVGVALATGPVTYAPATAMTVAGNPITAALADLDGDGDLDFVTANYGNPAGTGSNLSVGLNSGSGTFAVSTVTTTSGPRWVTPADVDADGDLDLLVPVASGVQVYANNGSGAFALLSTVSGINFAIAALGADVDGDGDFDLLTSNYFQGNTVSVRLNDGTGTFSGAQNVAVGTQPFHLAVGDVDGDGDLDFVTANQGAGTVSVRLNTGGTFAPPALAANGEVATGAGSSTVALGDVDGDGDLDLLASVSGGAVVRLNDGNGVFSAPASSGTLAGGFVALADMDADGDLDLATATGGTTVTVGLNQPPAPTLTSLTPNSGPVGASITLAGTNFTGATGVSFNGTAAVTFSVTNATTATATVPVGATSGNVTITTPSGTSNGVPFTVITNQAPTAIGLSPQSVAENTAGGSAIGNFSTTDPDAGNTHTYTLVAGTGSADNSVFSISGSQLVITSAPDFETKSAYAIRVRTTDQGSLFFEQTFTITVTNVNEAPSISPQTFSTAENPPNGNLVGLVVASDPDASTTLTYLITAGNTGGAFSFNASTNQLQVANSAAVNFETNPTFSLTVQVSDGTLTSSATVTVNLTNVNEAPVLTIHGRSIPENSLLAAHVGAPIPASDPDAGTTLTYSITSGNIGGAFGFGAGGQLEVANAAALDFETTPVFSLTVQVSDGVLTASATVTVNLTDVAESLVVFATQPVPAGNYINITVTGTGVGTLTGPVLVTGAFTVQPGGRLNTACQPITGAGSFTLATDATLAICDPAGISLSGPTGAVQVTGARAFAADATYAYNGAAAQVTGNGLPAAVRELEAANPGTLTLTQAAAVTHVLRLSAGTLVTSDFALTLRSAATRTAYAVHAGGLTSGAVTVQRYVPAPPAVSYHHLSSPVQNSPVSDLATAGFVPKVNPAYNALPYVAPTPALFPTVFGYDETRGGTTPAYAAFGTGYFSPATLGTSLTSGRGYSVYLPGQQTPDFVGALTTGSVPVALTVTGTNTSVNAQKAGWHLLGNPYPQPIDWDLATVPAGMEPTISVWFSTGGTSGAYRFRNAATQVGSLTDGVLALGQGFFARATAPTTFTFSNALRVENGTVPLGRAAAPAASASVPLLRLNLAPVGAPATHADATFLTVAPGATASLDAGLDALRPGRNVGVPTLATVVAGQEAAINALPETALTQAAETAVELTAVLPEVGAYTLTVGELAGFGPASLVLLDRLTRTRYDLTQQPTITLAATRANEEVSGRFAILLNGNRVLGTHSKLETENPKLEIAPNPASAQGAPVRLSGAPAGTRLVVSDLAGRIVASLPADATGAATLPTHPLAPGVYVVRAADGRTARLVVE